MEDIEEKIQNTKIKISKLNDFIALSLRRNNISGELERLTIEAIEVRDLLAKAYDLMEKESNTLKYDYEEIMSKMRRKQIVIMEHIIKEKQRKFKELEDEEKHVNLILSCGKTNSNINKTAPKSAVKMLGYNLNSAFSVTPKLKISEYKESPLVKRRITPLFQFEEFKVTIDQHQFDKIPKYMCGRETLEQLNIFLETVIIACFNEKYKLIHKERSCVRNLHDLELWKLYNEQTSYLPGRNFITPGDLTRKLNKMLDKKTQNRLVMLRHLGILNEVRVKQTVCYVWSYNSI